MREDDTGYLGSDGKDEDLSHSVDSNLLWIPRVRRAKNQIEGQLAPSPAKQRAVRGYPLN